MTTMSNLKRILPWAAVLALLVVSDVSIASAEPQAAAPVTHPFASVLDTRVCILPGEPIPAGSVRYAASTCWGYDKNGNRVDGTAVGLP